MTPQKSLNPRAWTELLALAAIWGASFLSVRVALDGMGVLTLVAWRVGGACLLLWAFVAAARLPVPRSAGIWRDCLVMGLLNNVVPFTLIAWAQLTVPSGLAAILNASTAILGVVIASLAFRDERLTPARTAGVLLGFAGVALVIGPSALAALDVTSLSQLALVGAALSYACAGVWARRRLGRIRPEVAAAGMLTGAAALMVPLALAVEGRPALGLGAAQWMAIGYLALVATAGAYLLYYRLIAMAGAGNMLLVTLLVAPFAVVLGAVMLDEVLPVRAYAGFALIAAGLVAIDGRVFRRKEPA